MDAIEFLKSEHRNVERILKLIREMSYLVLIEDEKLEYNDFEIIIECIRNYADSIHHKKEEDILFVKMLEKLPEAIRKTIQYGMLVEHDQGRLFVTGLEVALKSHRLGNDRARLSIISSGMEYANLLERHIDKEDRIIFDFAKKHLPTEDVEELNNKFSKVVDDVENKKYIEKLEYLEKKYL